jgi:hypothetical protein
MLFFRPLLLQMLLLYVESKFLVTERQCRAGATCFGQHASNLHQNNMEICYYNSTFSCITGRIISYYLQPSLVNSAYGSRDILTDHKSDVTTLFTETILVQT